MLCNQCGDYEASALVHNFTWQTLLSVYSGAVLFIPAFKVLIENTNLCFIQHKSGKGGGEYLYITDVEDADDNCSCFCERTTLVPYGSQRAACSGGADNLPASTAASQW